MKDLKEKSYYENILNQKIYNSRNNFHKSNSNYHNSNTHNSNTHNSNNSNKKIRSDFHLILSLIKDLLLYFLLLIPHLLLFIISLLFSSNKHKTKHYIEKIFFEPFKLIFKINRWFFEAKITSFLIITLIITYIIEVLFLAPFMNNLMTHQLHFFEGNFYSVFTSIFLHANLIHLSTNLLALLIFGRIVENHFKTKTLFIFIFGGIFANIVSNFVSYSFGDIYYSLGASGAIAGLIMFAIILNPFEFTSVFIIPLPIFIVGWVIIASDLIGLTNPSNINNLAHLAGYLTLLVTFFFLGIKDRSKILTGFMLNLVILLILYLSIQMFNSSIMFYIDLFRT